MTTENGKTAKGSNQKTEIKRTNTNKKMQTDPLEFWNKYELISSSKTYVPSRIKSKVCRYCDRTDKETTFNQITHLLPELIGENDILTFDECDICNKLFSDYESSFSIFIRPYITLLGVKGKKKVPIFQSRTVDRNEKTRTTLAHREGNQKELHIQTLDDYTINTDTKTVDIVFRKPPFIPLKVYKSLLKIGLSLLPTEFDKFNKESFAWLTNRQDDLSFITHAFVSTLKRRCFTTPSADLYKAKNIFTDKQEFPEYILIVCFANQIVQIFLPFSDELKDVTNGKRQLVLNLFPGVAYDKIEEPQTLEIKYFNLSIGTSITENHKISFSYEDAVINIPPK
ncbi:MAG: hypothetical protein H0V01_12810 [Bacteroidetes bacterium]|nr:hypothetical protein [Bacteroidota bacterium]HET6244216.1 hypothetical protein [Bacteroidia bacterium]